MELETSARAPREARRRPRRRRRSRRSAPIPLVDADEEFELERPYESPTTSIGTARGPASPAARGSPLRHRRLPRPRSRRGAEDEEFELEAPHEAPVDRLGGVHPPAAGRRGAAAAAPTASAPVRPRSGRAARAWSRRRPPPPPRPAARGVRAHLADPGRAVFQPGVHGQGDRGLPRADRAGAGQRAAERAPARAGEDPADPAGGEPPPRRSGGRAAAAAAPDAAADRRQAHRAHDRAPGRASRRDSKGVTVGRIRRSAEGRSPPACRRPSS